MRGGSIRWVFAALFGAAFVGACSDGKEVASHHPLAILGGDGLEWSVLRPLLLQGKMPNLKALIERGVAGKLATFIPTLSPIIWTSIATGKPLEEHGINGFIDPVTQQPFTSNARRGKALWNIASDYDLQTICVGWWVTWPAEEIHGYMVAPYSAAGQNDQNWKGNFNPNLENQTWPRDLLKELLPVADKYSKDGTGVKDAAERLFPKVQGAKLEQKDLDLFGQALWSAAADSTYTDLAIHLLQKSKAEKKPADLTMVYLGGPDVSSHRFWKFRSPGEFEFPIAPEEVALFDATIERYYQDFDAKIGRIVAELPPETNVIVCSDHGFHAVATKDPESPFSGHHMDAPPGVFIGAGPDFVKSPKSAAILDAKSTDAVPFVGKVMEVAPLALYLLGIPLAQDFHLPPDGGLLVNKTLVKDLVAKRPPQFAIYTHDDGFRAATRPLAGPAGSLNDITEWLRQNGYLEAGGGSTKEVNPRDGKDMVSPPEKGPSASEPPGDKAPALDFASSIRPLFEQYCVECHGEKKAKGGLRLDQWNDRLAGKAVGEKQAVIVPGKPNESELIRRVSLDANAKDHMPRGKESMPVDRIELLKRWIEAGAKP